MGCNFFSGPEKTTGSASYFERHDEHKHAQSRRQNRGAENIRPWAAIKISTHQALIRVLNLKINQNHNENAHLRTNKSSHGRARIYVEINFSLWVRAGGPTFTRAGRARARARARALSTQSKTCIFK